MRALVWHGGNRLALEEVPEPEPAPGETVVHVVLAGICGSDLHPYRGEAAGRVPPLVLGHEAIVRAADGPVEERSQAHSVPIGLQETDQPA